MGSLFEGGSDSNIHRNSRVYCAMDGRNVARLRTSLGSSSNELTQLNPAEPMVVTDPRAFVVAHFAVTKVMDWLRIKDGDQELLSVESSRSPCREFYHPVLPHAAEEPLQTSGAVESVQHSDVEMRDSDEENLDLTLDQQVEQHTILTTVSAQKGRWEVRRTPQEVFNVGLDMEALFAAERQHEFTGEATNHALASFFAMLPTGNEDHLRKKPGELDKMYQRARAEGRRLVADAAIIGRNPIICLIPLDAYGTRHFRSGPAVKAFSKVMVVLKECIDEYTFVEKVMDWPSDQHAASADSGASSCSGSSGSSTGAPNDAFKNIHALLEVKVSTLTAATTALVPAAKQELAALLTASSGSDSYRLMENMGAKMLKNESDFGKLLTLLEDEEDAKKASETAERRVRDNSYEAGDFVRYDDVEKGKTKTYTMLVTKVWTEDETTLYALASTGGGARWNVKETTAAFLEDCGADDMPRGAAKRKNVEELEPEEADTTGVKGKGPEQKKKKKKNKKRTPSQKDQGATFRGYVAYITENSVVNT
jgi:hypothetical protein